MADCSKSTQETIINDPPVTNLEPNLSNTVSEATSIKAVTNETWVYFDIIVTSSPGEDDYSLEKSNTFLRKILKSVS